MIRIAIAGAGYIANIHAAAIKVIPGVKLTAVVEKYSDKAEDFAHKYGIMHRFETVEEMINEGGVDALVICTPNYLHGLSNDYRFECRCSRNGRKTHGDERF